MPPTTTAPRCSIFNRDGLLVWRTFDLPEAEEIATILRKV